MDGQRDGWTEKKIDRQNDDDVENLVTITRYIIYFRQIESAIIYISRLFDVINGERRIKYEALENEYFILRNGMIYLKA